jgi:regulatory protein
LKKWGRIKIRQELKARGISESNIRLGLQEIDPDVYEQTLHELLEKKNRIEKTAGSLERKQKLLRFALSKGYEQDIVWDVINVLIP